MGHLLFVHCYKYIQSSHGSGAFGFFDFCQTLSEKAIEGQQIFTTNEAKWTGRKKKALLHSLSEMV